MFGGFKRGLQTIDFYQAVPSEYCEGTVSGACISIISIAVLVILTLSALIGYNEPQIDSDLIIDQKHLAEKLKVFIDIEFKHYPCGFLSLDVENVLKVHLVNIYSKDLRKFKVPSQTPFDDTNWDHSTKLNSVIEDLRTSQGCRMTGIFEIDRVPGNFHFSCHGYADLIPELIGHGFRQFDMEHYIHDMYFGEPSKELGTRSLAKFTSEKPMSQTFMGTTFTYFLDIVEKNVIYERGGKGREEYLYTARLNQVPLAQMPMVLFRYETNPVTVLEIISYESIHELLIMIVGILGGIFTVAAIIDSFIHSSIRFLIEKHRLNKLR